MFGYITPDGNTAIDFRFSMAYPFNNGYATACENGVWGVIDRNGKYIFRREFEEMGWLVGGFAWFQENGLYGLIDKYGTVIVDPQFASPIGPMVCERARVEVGGKFGFINERGEFAIPSIWQFARHFSEGFAEVGPHLKRFFIDVEGNAAFAGTYLSINPFSDGWASVRDQSGGYFIDVEGTTVLELPSHIQSKRFNEGLAAAEFVTRHNKTDPADISVGYICRKGEVVIPPRFDFGWHFQNGYATVVVEEKYGVIDRDGNWLAKPIFEDVHNFTCQRLAVKINGRYGFIDESANMVIEPRYRHVSEFAEDLSVVEI